MKHEEFCEQCNMPGHPESAHYCPTCKGVCRVVGHPATPPDMGSVLHDRVQLAKREAALAKIQREAAAALEFESLTGLLDDVGDERLRAAGRMFDTPTAQIRASCAHLVPSTTTTVNKLENEDGFHQGWYADIRINCAWCGQPFQWIGPMGISPDQPMVSADGLELRAPMRPGR